MTDTTVREPHLNVADLAWVPVTTPDGAHETWTLRQVLSGARHAKALDCSSPIELMALTRTLAAFMTLVCREAGVTDTLDTADDFDDSALAAATHTVLDRHRDALFLDHPTTPFFQEWRREGQDWTVGKPQNVDEKLRPESPSIDTSKLWWRRDRSRIDRPLSATEVVPLLLAYWFASFGKNFTPLNNDIGKSANFSIGLGNGNDAQFYWHHSDSLLATLLANIPLAWVTGQHLPAFLDRRRSAPRLDIAYDALWSSTYSHNACLLTWGDRAENSPTGVYTGVSRWGFYSPRTSKQTSADKEADKELATLLREQDFARFYSTGTDGKKKRLSKFDPSAAVLDRLHDWYSTLGTSHMSKKIEDRVLWAVSGSDEWAMDVFAAKVTGAQDLAIESVQWFSFDPSIYDLDSDAWETINELYESVVDNGKTGKQWRPGVLGALLSEIRKPEGPARGTGGNQSKAMRQSLSARAEHLFWSRCNKATSDFINVVAHGGNADEMSLLRVLRDEAIEIYDIVTAPLRSADRMFNIENSRARLLSTLYRLAPAPKEDAA